MKKIVCAMSVAILAAAASFATTYYVSDTGNDGALGTEAAPLKSLSAALAKADVTEVRIQAGDYADMAVTTVSSDNGTGYLGVIDKAVSIVGAGASVTTLHCRKSSYTRAGGLWINHAEAVVSGLSIMGHDSNGEGSAFGAAIHLIAGTVRDCSVTGSGSSNYRSPVCLAGAGALLKDCSVTNNVGREDIKRAGGIRIANGLAVRCLVAGNWGGDNGTEGNGVGLYGGEIRDSVITRNTGSNSQISSGAGGLVVGGGIARNCAIVGNILADRSPAGGTHISAGGVYMTGGVLTNCLVVGNHNYAVRNGTAGLLVNNAAAKVYNVTVVDNDSFSGRQMALKNGFVTNSIVHSPSGYCVERTGGTITGCNFPEAGSVAGVGNFASEPLFTHVTSSFPEDIDDYDVYVPALDSQAHALGYRPDDATPLTIAPSRRFYPAGSSAIVTAASQGLPAAIASYEWSLVKDGAAQPAPTGDGSFTLTAPAAGVYAATLVAKDASSATLATATCAFTVQPLVCYADDAGGEGTYPYDTPAKATAFIQKAIDTVYGGADTQGKVVVAPGIYAELPVQPTCYRGGRHLIVAKPIRVTGGADASQTILRTTTTLKLGGVHVGFPGACFDGFTIQGATQSADTYWRSGLVFQLTGGVASNCVVRETKNTGGTHMAPPAGVTGGLLTHSRIVDNHFTSMDWGRQSCGLRVDGGEVRHCEIARNTIDIGFSDQAYAGGLLQTGGLVADCIIASNTAGHKNQANGAGGVRIDGGTLERCIIESNTNPCADKNRAIGGLLVYGAATVRNCLIVGNTAASSTTTSSGGVYIDNAGASVSHLTVYNNSAAAGAGGLTMATAANNVHGCIVFGNTGSAAANLSATSTGRPDYSCFPEAETLGGTGNTQDDPLFKDSAVALPVDWETLAGFGITGNSPCKDTVTGGTAYAADDLVGNLRSADGTGETGYPDMGCLERQPLSGDEIEATLTTVSTTVPAGSTLLASVAVAGVDTTIASCVWHVAHAGITNLIHGTDDTLALAGVETGTYVIWADVTNGSGVSGTTRTLTVMVRPLVCHVARGANTDQWPYDTPANAASNLCDAIAAVFGAPDTPGTVHIAAGVYEDMKENTAANTYTYVGVLDKPAKIVGAGPDKTWIKYTSTDIGGGFLVINAEAEVRGVKISGAAKSPGDGYFTQHGIAVTMTGGIVSNCVMTQCRSNGSHTLPVLQMTGGLVVDCAVSDNVHSTSYGVPWGRGSLGVYVAGGRFLNCDVSRNRTAWGVSSDFTLAGALHQTGGVVSNCTFRGNVSYSPQPTQRSTAGACLIDGGTFVNSLVVGNTNLTTLTGNAAGGLTVTASATIRSVLVADNVASNTLTATAGGLALVGAGSLCNVTVAGNTSGGGASADGAYVSAGTLLNTIVHGNGTANHAFAGGTFTYSCYPGAVGTGNIAGDPGFKKSSGYRLYATSPCARAGLFDASWMAEARDLAGVPLQKHGRVPMGCYAAAGYATTIIVR